MTVRDSILALQAAMNAEVLGQPQLVERMLIGLLADGHLLIEGLPGLAKTRAVKALAKHLQADFSRIQFTPDLLPSDVTGTEIYYSEGGKGEFKFQPGPVFGNLLLADEINRAPAKVQSALLEAMQEHQVTIGDHTYPLPEPFMVMATQNPIEQEGTYPLPEAQIDRFMLKVVLGYPTREEERRILDLMAVGEPPMPSPVLSPGNIARARQVVETIYMDDKIKNYIVNLVMATRDPEAYRVPIKSYLQFGASPRATIYLARAARAHAFLSRRGHVIPDDIKLIGPDVLRHRLIVSYEAEAEGKTPDDLIKVLFDHVEVP
jgi:MoxR-like ATPase